VKRRDLLVAATGLGLAGAGVLTGAAKARTDSSSSARNVLLIIADDQGYDLSCCGGRVKTPVLDNLITQGTLFTQGFATVSSCSSSRATLYTGLY
jgi:N-sulfoglucosamine sulfohydrolase